jgi:hypothetical protein
MTSTVNSRYKHKITRPGARIAYLGLAIYHATADIAISWAISAILL